METGLACSTATGPKFGNCKNSQSISLENMSPDPASITARPFFPTSLIFAELKYSCLKWCVTSILYITVIIIWEWACYHLVKIVK